MCNSIPCALCGLQFQISLPNENEIDILITGMATKTMEIAQENNELGISDELLFAMDQPDKIESKSSSLQVSQESLSNSLRVSVDPSLNSSIQQEQTSNEPIIVTNLEYIPGSKIKRFFGRVSHHFIREAKENKEKETSQLSSKSKLGNLSCIFLREAISIARAHVIAMGGNALVGFSIDSFVLVARSGYCLVSFSGDIVEIRK